MDPFMPDWVIDLRNNGYKGPYGTEFYNWWYSEPTAYKALAESICQQVMEFLGNRTVWNALPYKFRANLEEEFDRHMEQFEEWLMETYPQGVPC